MKNPQNHEMIGVVPWVLDGHVLEDTTIGPQNVVRPVPHYPPLPPRFPRSLIPTTRPLSWEEISLQILQACLCHRRRDTLVLSSATLLPKVHIQVPRNNQLRPPRFLCYLHLHVSDGFSVARRQVTSRNVPAPLPRHQLAHNDVRTELVYRLDCEDGGFPIEDCNTTLVSARCRRRGDPISCR